jgi:hypothetical protein
MRQCAHKYSIRMLRFFRKHVLNGKFSMRWYGALADGSDDVLKLQKVFDVCTFGNKIKNIWWPGGNYTITKGCCIDRDDNGDGIRDFLRDSPLKEKAKPLVDQVKRLSIAYEWKQFWIQYSKR